MLRCFFALLMMPQMGLPRVDTANCTMYNSTRGTVGWVWHDKNAFIVSQIKRGDMNGTNSEASAIVRTADVAD